MPSKKAESKPKATKSNASKTTKLVIGTKSLKAKTVTAKKTVKATKSKSKTQATKSLVLPHGVIQKKFKTAINSLNETQTKISVRKNVEFFLTGALEYIIVRIIDESVALMGNASQFKPHYLFDVLKPRPIPTEISEGGGLPYAFSENELYESLGSYTGKLEYLNEYCAKFKGYKEPNSWKTYIERIYKAKVNNKKTFSNQTKLLIIRLVNLIFDRIVAQSKVNLNMNNVKTIDARNIEACIRGAFSPSFSDKVVGYANSF